MMKRMLVLFMLAAVSTTVFTGCETTEGAGRDLENLGSEVQEI